MNPSIRKISLTLHRWIALLSGLVVFIVCITGALYAFRDEITDLIEPWKFVTPRNTAVIQPSEVLSIANQVSGQNKPTAITYGEAKEAVFVDYFDSQYGITTIFINPYDGQIVKTIKRGKNDFHFFSFILSGHRTLWLPAEIGRPIVGWSVILFIIELITGIILWLPKKWKYLKNNFRVRKKRISFDLHNTFGGLFFPFLIVASLTGLVWSFTWFSQALYTLTGGKELKPYILPQSDTTNINNQQYELLDELYAQIRKEEPEAATIYIALPFDASGVFRVSIEHKKHSYYRTDNLFFDQYTLKPLKGQGPYAGKYTQVSTPDKIRRMNLEIHDGRIFGLFGKIVAFCSSLTGAMLIVTGFLLWKKKTSKKNPKIRRNSKIIST